MTTTLSSADHSVWYADFGATEHMTDQRQWFQTFSPIADGCWSVTMADDFTLWVRGVGDVTLKATVNGSISSVRLKDVLYVPMLQRNLISTSKLTENGIAILHISATCKMISEDGKGHLIITVHRSDGLWILDVVKQSKQSFANAVISSSPSVPELSRADCTFRQWHHRLGHLSAHTLKKMAQQDIVIGLTISDSADLGVCSGCTHGKQHRTPFPVNAERTRSRYPGQFFHTDISGPM